MSDFLFKIATEPEELRQIRALNYRTFVEEIPQHHPNQEHSLTDRFEQESTYFICRSGDEVIGMVAVRCNRPFSLDGKLPDLAAYLPPHRSACEVRLLAVEPKHRKGRVLAGLVGLLYQFCEARGHDLVLISGTTRQIKLYEHLGFTAFGPLVGTPGAQYQPMCQFVDRFRKRVAELESAAFAGVVRPEVNLMPGPVYLSPAVQEALGAKPVSHRAESFRQLLERTRAMLCELTGAPAVVVASGSGTLANDLVAGQLAQFPGRGLILSNGEFGRRLADHATRFQLDFETVEIPWGEAFDEGALRRALAGGAPKAWLWAVHAETSTGVLNDLAMLKRVAQEISVPLCLDCVSALGVVPCDLRGVALASGVSGKGLRSMAGLALVFHDGRLPPPVCALPRYLDLRLYLVPGVPFTLSSSLLAALSVAVETLSPGTRFSEVRETADWLCRRLLEVGVKPLAADAVRFPGAITLPVPLQVDARALGSALQRDGWLLSYQSSYLVERNWIQICLFEPVAKTDLEPLPSALAAALKQKPELRCQQASDVKTLPETTSKGPAAPEDASGAGGGRGAAGLAAAVFCILYLALVALLARTAHLLPDRVASHFGAGGAADGWMSRSGYLLFTAGFPLVIGLILAGVSAMVGTLPACLINIPRKDFWLIPERRALTVRIIRNRLTWLLSLMTLFFAGLHVLTVEANRCVPAQLPMGGLLLVVTAFLLALMIWVILLLMKFAETGEATPTPRVKPLPKNS